jgi:hypothetical protein
MNMFKEVQKMLSVAKQTTVSAKTGVPLHSVRRITAGEKTVRYVHVETLHRFFYGEGK